MIETGCLQCPWIQGGASIRKPRANTGWSHLAHHDAVETPPSPGPTGSWIMPLFLSMVQCTGVFFFGRARSGPTRGIGPRRQLFLEESTVPEITWRSPQ